MEDNLMAQKFKDVMSCLKVIPAAFLVKTPPSHQANNSPPSPGAGENTPQNFCLFSIARMNYPPKISSFTKLNPKYSFMLSVIMLLSNFKF